MTSQASQVFCAVMTNATLNTTTNDFFQLRGVTGTTAQILEVRVYQRGSNATFVDSVMMMRGPNGAGGSSLSSEFKYHSSGNTPVFQAFQAPTTNISSETWRGSFDWHLLEDAVWMPDPALKLELKGGTDGFGIQKRSTTAHTGVGVFIAWEEFTA